MAGILHMPTTVRCRAICGLDANEIKLGSQERCAYSHNTPREPIEQESGEHTDPSISSIGRSCKVPLLRINQRHVGNDERLVNCHISG